MFIVLRNDSIDDNSYFIENSNCIIKGINNFGNINSKFKKDEIKNVKTIIFRNCDFTNINSIDVIKIKELVSSINSYNITIKFEQSIINERIITNISNVLNDIRNKNISIITNSSSQSINPLESLLNSFMMTTDIESGSRSRSSNNNDDYEDNRLNNNALLKQIYSKSVNKKNETIKKIISNSPNFCIPQLYEDQFSDISIISKLKTNLMKVLNFFITECDSVKQNIIDLIVNSIKTGKITSNVGLGGSPGTGKTSFATGVAACLAYIDLVATNTDYKNKKVLEKFLSDENINKMLVEVATHKLTYGRYLVMLNLSSIHDFSELTGSGGVYANAEPGAIFKHIAASSVDNYKSNINPFLETIYKKYKYNDEIKLPKYISTLLLFLDEIEKFNVTVNNKKETGGYDELLNILEKTNGKFKDQNIDAEIPSDALLICGTYNDFDRLTAPLKDRIQMKLFFSGYTIGQKIKIFKTMLEKSLIINFEKISEIKDKQNQLFFDHKYFSINLNIIPEIVKYITSQQPGMRIDHQIIEDLIINIVKHYQNKGSASAKMIIDKNNYLDFISDYLKINLLSPVNNDKEPGRYSIITYGTNGLESTKIHVGKLKSSNSNGLYSLTFLGGFLGNREELHYRHIGNEMIAFILSLIGTTEYAGKISTLLQNNSFAFEGKYYINDFHFMALSSAIALISYSEFKNISLTTTFVGSSTIQGILTTVNGMEDRIKYIFNSNPNVNLLVLPQECENQFKSLYAKYIPETVQVVFANKFSDLIEYILYGKKAIATPDKK